MARYYSDNAIDPPEQEREAVAARESRLGTNLARLAPGRRGLIGFLFGAAASAQAVKPEIEGEVIHAFRLKPKNGECPVCGEVRSPVSAEPVVTGQPVPSWQFRCRFCSVAFWQDSEK